MATRTTCAITLIQTRRTCCDSQSLKQRIMVVMPAMMLWRRGVADELAAKYVAGMQLFFGRL